ncbi:MAG: BMP family ABC transporter substrate-binding protein [Solirubrobacteraceae bacterium]
MSRHKVLTGLAVALSAGALAACGSDDKDTSSTATSGGTSTTATAAKDGPKIAVLTPAPRNDGGLAQFVIEGAGEAAKSTGGELAAIVDNVTDPQKQIQGLRNLAEDNDIVIAASGSLNQATEAVADKYPDTIFIQLLAPTKTFHKNVTAVVPQLGLNAIVAGAVMATGSKSKKLGVVAGLEIPASTEEVAGISQGAKLVDPSVDVASTFTGDYNDVGKAKQGGAAQMADGVDQILGDLDSGIRGLTQAAEAGDAEVYQVFGLTCDASSSITGSARVSFAALANSAITDAAAGSLEPGALFITLKDPDKMRFEFCPGKGTPEQKKIAQETTDKLVSGEITPDEGVVDPDPGYSLTTQ